MAIDITSPSCGNDDDLTGSRTGNSVTVTCHACGHEWARPLAPHCPTCGSADMRAVPLAILERSRGTQLSVVGIRMVDMCSACDHDAIERWHANRPNPLMPAELPTVDRVDTD
ncbi:MAG TPA: hypothetical protein VGC11_08560 [Acidimicrobiia bacterium]|jgi:hypothetical protein